MIVGSLGSVVFGVNDREVKTIRDMSWKKSAKYATHTLLGQKSLLEYTGLDEDEISFTVVLSAYMGVNPQEGIAQFSAMLENGEVVSLLLGTDVIGSRWVLCDMAISIDQHYSDGTPTVVTLKLSIKEYAG